MLINQQITDELKSHIWALDWQNCCDDKTKYTIDATYREQVKNDWFTKLEAEIDEYKDKVINKAEYKTFLQLLNPFAPHMTEELFNVLGETKTINETPWPVYDAAKTIDDEIEIPVQVNGKVKAVVLVAKEATQEEVKAVVDSTEAVQNAVAGKTIVKEIYVNGRIYNIVVK